MAGQCIIIVMGVSVTGKSSVGTALANAAKKRAASWASICLCPVMV